VAPSLDTHHLEALNNSAFQTRKYSECGIQLGWTKGSASNCHLSETQVLYWS
jgi:hypothetical protein